MTGGERRLAYRLEQKLEDDWLPALYDNAQSIYGRDKRGKISFKSLGIQAQGRTTILKINYRNTQEVLELASGIASDLLKPSASDEDGVPLVAPISAGSQGPKPLVIELPTLRKDTVKLLTMHSWKRLEFPLVAILGAGRAVDEGRRRRGCCMSR